MAIFIVEAGDEAFGLNGADLFLGEVDHGEDKAANQILRSVERRDLGAGFFHSEFWAKVHLKDVGGLSGLGKRLGAQDSANAQLHLGEVGPFDGFHFHDEHGDRGRAPVQGAAKEAVAIFSEFG